MKYTFDLELSSHGLILVAGKWKRLDDPLGMRLFTKSEMEALGFDYKSPEDD